MVDSYIMDERPERSLCLSREPAIADSNTVANRKSRQSIGRLFLNGSDHEVVACYSRLYEEGEVDHINGVWPAF